MATGGDIVRPLGHLETFSTSRHALGIYRGIALACEYSVPDRAVKPEALETALRQALARAVLRLPSLRVGIKGEDTNTPAFVRVPSLNLQEAIQWTSVSAPDEEAFDAATLRAIEDRLEQLWPDVSTRPPWKLIVVRNNEDPSRLNIIFATHHALSDGKSTALFHSVLLEELNRPAAAAPAELEGQLLRLPGASRLAPPQEELVRFRISWGFLLRTLWAHFAPAWLRGPAPMAPWAGRPVSLEPRGLRLRLVELPAGTVPGLLAGCRARGATLTSLLQALTLASLARRLPADVAPAFEADTAVSTHRLAAAPAGLELSEVMTDMNAAVEHAFGPEAVAGLRAALRGPAAEDHVWGLAAGVRADLARQLATLTTDNVVGLMAWVGDWRQFWLDKVGKPRAPTWAVSNIGSMSAAKAGAGAGAGEGGWRIRRSMFAQPAMVAGPAFALNVAGVEGGPITIVLNSQEGIVDEELMDGVAADLRAWTANFQEGGAFGVGSQAD